MAQSSSISVFRGDIPINKLLAMHPSINIIDTHIINIIDTHYTSMDLTPSVITSKRWLLNINFKKDRIKLIIFK